jgi:hypothetical protein
VIYLPHLNRHVPQDGQQLLFDRVRSHRIHSAPRNDANDETILGFLDQLELPLAWLTGSDIYVEELDRAFKESMDELQQVFKKMYPMAPYATKINTQVLAQNRIGPVDPTERTSLLFSGGVDSTYSLITNLHHQT